MRVEKDGVDGLFLDNTFRNIQKMRLRKLSDHSHGGNLSNDFVLFGLVEWVNLSEVWKNKETVDRFFFAAATEVTAKLRINLRRADVFTIFGEVTLGNDVNIAQCFLLQFQFIRRY